jgi:hypothetical protein
MPIGRVSSDIFDKEISGEKKPEVQIIDKPSKGRKEGDVNVPEGLRKLIGETAAIDGRQSGIDLAKRFNISASSVSAYANGATSTTSYNEPKAAIKSHIIKSKERAVKRASVTLNQALSAITQEKLDYADPKDLAGIAKDMTVIIKNLEPPNTVESGQGNQPQFTIYAPTFRDERSFEVITVQE